MKEMALLNGNVGTNMLIGGKNAYQETWTCIGASSLNSCVRLGVLESPVFKADGKTVTLGGSAVPL